MSIGTCSVIPTPQTTPAPRQSQADVYLSDYQPDLYAIAPESGATRWCDQFTVTGPPPPGFCGGGPCAWPVQARIGKPLLADGALYVCVAGPVSFTFALNASDGTQRWMQKSACAVDALGGRMGLAIPALAHGVVYSGQDALDAATGAVRWRLPAGVTPAAADASALYGYTQTTISAWSADSGKPLWSYAAPGRNGSLPIAASGAIYASVIGAGSATGVLALEARTGKLLWQTPTGLAPGALVAAHGDLYAGGMANGVIALDAASGRVRWRYDIAAGPTTAPVIGNGALYVIADDLYALDATTGALRWRQPLADRAGPAIDPALASGDLFTGYNDSHGFWRLVAISVSARAILWDRVGLDGIAIATVV